MSEQEKAKIQQDAYDAIHQALANAPQDIPQVFKDFYLVVGYKFLGRVLTGATLAQARGEK
jgi:hypothetical protein